MSMLSGQCAKLRTLARDVRELADGNSDWPWKAKVTLHEAAAQMELAADSLAHLGDAGAENAELRGLVRDMWLYMGIMHGISEERRDEIRERMEALGMEVYE